MLRVALWLSVALVCVRKICSEQVTIQMLHLNTSCEIRKAGEGGGEFDGGSYQIRTAGWIPEAPQAGASTDVRFEPSLCRFGGKLGAFCCTSSQTAHQLPAACGLIRKMLRSHHKIEISFFFHVEIFPVFRFLKKLHRIYR